MRIDGTLKSWNDERGFGFIQPAPGGPEIFVHIKAFEALSGRPQIGQRLTFEIGMGATGKKRAQRVQSVHGARTSARRHEDSPVRRGGASYFAIPAFLFLYLVAALLWRVPNWVAGLYLAASAACFVAYAIDKSAATAGRWRVPEGRLILLGLAGGWPGAIVAQQVLRHKSAKVSFRAVFWGSVLVSVLGFLVLSSPLRSFLRP